MTCLRGFIVTLSAASVLCCCGPTKPPAKPTSASWRLDQISLSGQWHPSTAFQAANGALLDYVNRLKLEGEGISTLVLYLDNIASEEVMPAHKLLYDAVLDEIAAHVQDLLRPHRIVVTRKPGPSWVTEIDTSPAAERKLCVSTTDWNGATRIAIFNLAKKPFTNASYGAAFRAPAKFEDESPM